MKNRKLLLIVSLVLALTMSLGGTLAYLQDSDVDVNVMTLGNVQIEQHEYQRVEKDGKYETGTIDEKTSYVLEAFEQNKPLLPIVGDPSLPGNDPGYAGWDSTPVRMSQVDSYGGMDVFAGKNAVDKFVTVENTGKTDAYVRTIVAVEVGSTDGSLVGTSYHGAWTKNEIGKVTINGNGYIVFEYIYAGAQLSDGSYRHEKGILPAGDTTYPNLAQVYLKHYANNDDMVAIDGNKNGTLDILVLSQAIQADGWDDANTALEAGFGAANAENIAKWFGDEGVKVEPVVVKNDAELAAAVAAGETNITLAAGTYYIDGCSGKTLTLNGTEATVLKLKNEGEDGCDYSFGGPTGVGNITFNGVTIDTTDNTGNYKGYSYMKGTFNNCNFVGAYSLNNANDFVFNNCTFDFQNGYFWTWSAKSVTFEGCTFNGNSKCILAHGYESTAITINNCKFAATAQGFTGAGDNTACVEIDPAGSNTYTINFTGINSKTDSYAGWTRVKDSSTGHTITGLN